MNPRILVDCHTHTAFSFDSTTPLEQMCRQALRLGISVYAVTDHCDHCADTADQEPTCLEFDKSRAWEDTEEAFLGVSAWKEAHPDFPVKVLNGIELGQSLQDLPVAEQILARPYDMVIGSLHSISGHPDFYYLNYREMSKVEIDRLLSAYFKEMLRTVVWGKFDTLAHITYPFRYLVEQGVPFSLSSFDDQIDEVLRALAQSGKALEVNTSGLRQKIGQTLPPEKYLKRFRELGGEFVTIGSDAHRVEDVGSGIKEGYHILQKAGFSKLTYFEKRRPVLIKL